MSTKPTIDQLRALLNRLFTTARKLATTPRDVKALHERESAAADKLFQKLLRREFGDDDWIRRR
jgi:hypothetical protein